MACGSIAAIKQLTGSQNQSGEHPNACCDETYDLQRQYDHKRLILETYF